MKELINIKDSNALNLFSRNFENIILKKINNYDSIVILCIGTDRSTGDSLGVLVGYKLQESRFDKAAVYGTLESPVHAKNLKENIDMIYEKHRNPLIIAIDACLGEMNHVGYIQLSEEKTRPGSALDKNLPEVGDISIAGIVNFSGYMDFMVLQNTRLHTVMSLAEIISKGIKNVLDDIMIKNIKIF